MSHVTRMARTTVTLISSTAKYPSYLFRTVPSMHLPLFGTTAKALRREQAIFLLDQQGFDVNATDSVRNWLQTNLQ